MLKRLGDLVAAGLLVVALWGLWVVAVPRAEAAGGVIKGDYALHSHGQELFLVNRKTGAVYRWLGEGSEPSGVKWTSQKRSPFDDGYL